MAAPLPFASADGAWDKRSHGTFWSTEGKPRQTPSNIKVQDNIQYITACHQGPTPIIILREPIGNGQPQPNGHD